MAISTNAQTISATQRYFHDLQNHSLLSRDEEKELSRRYRDKNDQTALSRLITGNLRLVVKIAKDFYNDW